MKATAAQYALAWYEAVKEKPKSENKISQTFLKRLRDSGELSSLPRIIDELIRIENKELGIVDVLARVAGKHPEKEVKKMALQLLNAKEVRLKIEEDPDLLGGLVLETENERFDLSVQKQLQDLRMSL